MSDTIDVNYKAIHILLIQTAGDDRASLENRLRQSSPVLLKIAYAESVDDGLKKLESGPPDVIFIDLSLLGGNESDLINQVVSAAPQSPVIALVDLADEDQGVEAMQNGVFDYMVKEQIGGALVKHCLYHIVRYKRLQNEYGNHQAHMQVVMDTHTNALKRANLRLQQEIEERKQAEQSERNQRLFSESLRDITSCLLSSTDIKDIYQRILVGLEGIFPHDAANIMLLKGDQVQVVGCLGYDRAGSSDEQMLEITYEMTALTGLLKMIEEGMPLIFNNVRNAPDWLENPKTDWIGSYIGAPIRAGDTVIGFLNLDSTRTEAFTLEHGLLLQTFADQAAIAIRNARIYRELENYSLSLERAVSEATSEAWEAKERIEVILNSIGEGLIVVGFNNSVIERVNPAFEKLSGYSSEHVVGMQYPVLLPDTETAKEQLSQISAAVQSRETWRGEYPFRRKDGSVFDAAVTINPLKDSTGKLLGHVVSVRDISGYKELQHMKDNFLSTAAHELRTPMTAIQGFSEILLTRQIDEKRKAYYLKMINDQAVHVSKIINDLLDISRLEAGLGMGIRAEAFDICRTIREVVQPFIETSKKHEYRFDFPSDSIMVFGDPFRLGQVINNLVSNATKYSPDGGSITTHLTRVGDCIEVAVQDDGFGISPGEQQNIFDKFYRANAAVSTAGGTGLGLTIARLIVEMHKGKIWVESAEGRGSRFIFTVPLVDEHE
jgi:PAS domain S-box-containing protein